MIYVDADACPVKAEVEQVATRHKVAVSLFAMVVFAPLPTRLLNWWLWMPGQMWLICGSQSGQGPVML